MKRICGFAIFAALFSGCASEFGIYYENAGAVRYDTTTLDVTPLFSVGTAKPAVEDQGREALLGRWRVLVNEDRISYTAGKLQQCFGMSQWEIDEYEFSADGRYFMRRVSRDGKTVLKDSGEEGRWTCADGILRLRTECMVFPGAYSFMSPSRNEFGDRKAWIAYRMKWHSRREFSLEYENPNAAMRDRYQGAVTKCHYDGNGCFFYQGSAGDFRWSAVNNPKCFRRVGNE